jgi:TolA-binding protein
VWEAADELFRRGEEFRTALPTAEARSRMYYDSAWAFRWLSEVEINRAWDELRKQANGKPVERSKVPVQGAEEREFTAYRKLIEDFPDAAAAIDARFELAELLAERGQTDDAVKLLKDALDKEPTDKPVSPDLLERVRLRLGAALAAKKEFPAAAAQFDAVAANAKSPYLAQALYRSGECLVSAGEYEKAAEKLKIFRDKGEFHNVGGLSDRAMLRLGQALLGAKKWDEARQAFETTLQRFGNGNPFAADARYGVGLAQQGAGKLDEAVGTFQAVIAATTAEVAAKAQLQIGQCRLAQKKYAAAAAAFQLVAFTYDFPEVGYAATLEAARAFADDGKPAEAERVLAKLLKDAPKDSEWAKAAAERLGKLKK